MSTDSEYYLAPRQFSSKYDVYYNMKVGEELELPMTSYLASRIVTALHKNKKIVLKEHRRYSVRALPPVDGVGRCVIKRQA